MNHETLYETSAYFYFKLILVWKPLIFFLCYIQRWNDFPKYILGRDEYSIGGNDTEFDERIHSVIINISSTDNPEAECVCVFVCVCVCV